MATPSADVKKFLPLNMVQVFGKFLPAIQKAVNTEIATTEELIQACIDQLFLSTASGKFLVQLGEQSGFVLPSNSGLDIRSYRVLVPVMVSSPKQVRLSIEELIQAFYLGERTKPAILSTIAGPYSLEDGDDLIVETESGLSAVSIVTSQVSDLNNVSAQEIAAVLNTSQDLYIAEADTDRGTGLSSVKIISKTLGSRSFLRIAGGKMQNILKFPSVIDVLSTSGTTWNLSKTSPFSDELMFTWDGTGVNPAIYRNKIGDVVTIRGLTDGADPFSLINGSYEIIDVGYDNFTVRNDLFDVTTSVLVQPNNNSIVFTKNENVTVFDNDEFAIASEIQGQTITVTVPAVPPLVRRFLQGSAHLHSNIHSVLDFTRNTLQIEVGAGQDAPAGDNNFVLQNKFQRANFTSKFYKTEASNLDPLTPTLATNVANDDVLVLPHTTATNLGDTPVFAEVLSSEYKVIFPFKHGLQNFWGFTLADLTGEANALASDLNKEHVVRRVVNETEAVFELKDSSNNPVIFDGIPWSAGNVFRHPTNQADGSDFYIDFGTVPAMLATGLIPGLTFRLDPFLGTNVDAFLASELRFRTLTVTSISGSRVNFSSGLGPGPQGSIILGVPGVRSGLIGGSAGTYLFDKTSVHNIDRVMSGLQTVFMGYTPSSNPLYLGSYIYDPDGVQSSLTVSKFLVKSTDNIFKGESRPALFVDDSGLSEEDQSSFPQTGEIVVDYGTSNQEGPIRYTAYVKNPTTTQILIDPAYQFEKSHGVGSQIQFIHDNVPYTPTTDGEDYPFYLTGTVNARNTMFDLVELLVASGIFVEQDVVFPELRYEDPAITIFE